MIYHFSAATLETCDRIKESELVVLICTMTIGMSLWYGKKYSVLLHFLVVLPDGG